MVASGASLLGERVAGFLDADPGVDEVVVLRAGDRSPDAVSAAMEGAAAIVHIAPPDLAAALVAAASGVSHFVQLSSAMVYGAWPDNSVPLSEETPLRPNPGFRYAAERAEAERMVLEWQDDHAGATAAILRPTVMVGPGSDPSLTRSLAGIGLRSADSAHPSQCVHGDDVVSAVLLALRNRLEGVFNVAPEGWMPDDTARALAGGPARVALPDRVVRPVRRLMRAFGGDDGPAGIEPYTRYPWVVASDKLRNSGWRPQYTNEEALVLGIGPQREISPKRRQEVALGVAVAGIAATGSAVVAMVRRRKVRR